MHEIYHKIPEILKRRQKAALCTIVSTSGSTPLKPGAKMIVLEDGQVIHTVGGGNFEKKVIENARVIMQSGKSGLFTYDLLRELDMCCGGTVKVFIEKIENSRNLYIFGAGHVGRAVAKHAGNLEFDTYLIDDRKEELDKSRELPGVNLFYADFYETLKCLPFSENTFIVILTYNHQLDRDILAFCLRQPHEYLGMIGSKRKVQMTRKLFLAGKIATEEELNEVDMPIGFDLRGQTPEEIAIGIIARLVEVKNLGRKAELPSLTIPVCYSRGTAVRLKPYANTTKSHFFF